MGRKIVRQHKLVLAGLQATTSMFWCNLAGHCATTTTSFTSTLKRFTELILADKCQPKKAVKARLTYLSKALYQEWLQSGVSGPLYEKYVLTKCPLVMCQQKCVDVAFRNVSIRTTAFTQSLPITIVLLSNVSTDKMSGHYLESRACTS